MGESASDAPSEPRIREPDLKTGVGCAGRHVGRLRKCVGSPRTRVGSPRMRVGSPRMRVGTPPQPVHRHSTRAARAVRASATTLDCASMLFRPHFLAALATVGVVTFAHAAHAQQGATAPASEARAAFDRGVAALDDGRYRDAVESLEHSRALHDVPIVNYNLGLAYRALGRNLDAIATFERYLAQPDPRATPDEVTAVRTVVAELHGSIASIEVHVVPSTAVVLLDGRPIALDHDVALVDPGSHVIEVSADGYTLARRELALTRGGRETVTMTLTASGGPAHLIVVPSVASAVTSIDGQPQPTATIDRALPAGDHLVTIRASGYEPFERHVTLGATGIMRVEARLSRAAATSSWVLPVAVSAGAAIVLAGAIGGLVYAFEPRQGDLRELPPTAIRISE